MLEAPVSLTETERETNRAKEDGECYLSKATLAQHHEQIEVGQFHAVPVAIAVEF